MNNLFAAVALTTLASAMSIHPECLAKNRDNVGISLEGTVFDQTDAIAANLDTTSVLSGYRVCVNANGELNSFVLAWKNQNTGDAKVSESVGPESLGTCINVPIPNPGSILGARMFYDTQRVTGIELGIFGSLSTVLIGAKTSSYKVAVFSEKQSFAGFWGIASTDRITLLGYVTLDIPCSETLPNGGTGDREYDPTAEDDSDRKQMAFMIILSIFGGVILLFCCIWGCLCKNK